MSSYQTASDAIRERHYYESLGRQRDENMRQLLVIEQIIALRLARGACVKKLEALVGPGIKSDH